MVMYTPHEPAEWVPLSCNYLSLPLSSSSSSSSSAASSSSTSSIAPLRTKQHAYTEENVRGYGLVRVIAFILDKIVDQRNTATNASPSSPTSPASSTKFHASRPPCISLLQYLLRILKYASCSAECFVLALIYIDRLEKAYPVEETGSSRSAPSIVSQLSVHRIVLTSIVLAAKFFDDQYYNNAYYAKVGGISCREMNALEAVFLQRISFRLHVQREEYVRYYNELVKHVNFRDGQKERSPLYARERRKPSIAAGMWSSGNSTASLPVLQCVKYGIEYEDDVPVQAESMMYVQAQTEPQEQTQNQTLAYTTTFYYGQHLRVEYVENLFTASIRCTTYCLSTLMLPFASPAYSLQSPCGSPTSACACTCACDATAASTCACSCGNNSLHANNSATPSCYPCTSSCRIQRAPYVSPVTNRVLPSPLTMSATRNNTNRMSSETEKQRFERMGNAVNPMFTARNLPLPLQMYHHPSTWGNYSTEPLLQYSSGNNGRSEHLTRDYTSEEYTGPTGNNYTGPTGNGYSGTAENDYKGCTDTYSFYDREHSLVYPSRPEIEINPMNNPTTHHPQAHVPARSHVHAYPNANANANAIPYRYGTTSNNNNMMYDNIMTRMPKEGYDLRYPKPLQTIKTTY